MPNRVTCSSYTVSFTHYLCWWATSLDEIIELDTFWCIKLVTGRGGYVSFSCSSRFKAYRLVSWIIWVFLEKRTATRSQWSSFWHMWPLPVGRRPLFSFLPLKLYTEEKDTASEGAKNFSLTLASQKSLQLIPQVSRVIKIT